MYCLRRVAFRALSIAPSSTTTIGSRAFSRIAERTSATSICRAYTPRFQRRWLADEPAAIRSEPVTDGAETTQHQDADNSIASAPDPADPASETLTEEPPKTEEQAVASYAQDPITTESVEPESAVEQQSVVETVEETVKSAAETVGAAATGSPSEQPQEQAADPPEDQSVSETAKETVKSAAETVGAAATGSPSEQPQEQAADPPKSQLYVGNLFFDIRDEDLAKEFSRAGRVKNSRVIKDARGLSKGFGYVDFENEADAAKALHLFHMQNFEGRRLTVQYAIGERRPRGRANPADRSDRSDRPPSPPTKTLFIGNMSFDMSDRDLNTLFRGIKNVIDVRVAIDRRTGQPRGFAHADFTDIESAQRAMEDLSGKMVCGRTLRVDFSHSTGRAAL